MALYYVSAGTTVPAATHANIAAVNADAGITSGDTVYFNRGETFNDATLATDAGVTYDAYGTGADPIIDGVDTQLCITVAVDNVTINNLEINNGYALTNRGSLDVASTAANLTVSNCTFRGSTTADKTQACIHIRSTGTGHTFTNCDIYAPHSSAGGAFYGIYILNGGSGTFSNINMYGVSGNTPSSAILVFNSTGTYSFDDVTITDWGTYDVSAKYVVWIRQSTSTTVEFTRLTSNSAGGISVEDASTATFTDPTISGLTRIMQSIDTATITISGGTITLDTEGAAFAGTAVTISDTDFTGGLVAGTATSFTLTNVTASDSTTGGIHTSSTTSTLTNCTVNNAGAGHGFRIYGGTSTLVGCTASVTDANYSGFHIETNGTVANLERCIAHSNLEDGFSVNNTTTVTLEGCKSYNNGQAGDATSGDGYTSHDASSMTLKGCTGYGNHKSGCAVTGTSSGSISNCTFYNNGSSHSDHGIWINSTDSITGWTVKNTICFNNSAGDIEITAAAVTGSVLYVGDYNYLGSGGSTLYYNGSPVALAAWKTSTSSDANSLSADPLLTDATNNDLTLTASSPCVGAGEVGLGNFVGADGEPFPGNKGFGWDIGGIQSKHDPFHPTNL